MKLNSARRKGRKQNNSNQTFESQGPEGKIRGTAHQIFDKYMILARDATSSGDRVTAENFYQYAEHYYRLIHADNENESGPWYEENRRSSSFENRQKSYNVDISSAENNETIEKAPSLKENNGREGRENRFENRRSRHPFSDRMNRHRPERDNKNAPSDSQRATNDVTTTSEDTQPSTEPFITVLQ